MLPEIDPPARVPPSPPPRSPTRFITRRVNCLEAGRANPAEIPKIGAYWWPQGDGITTTIRVHSAILAVYLSLKPNSLNKNLQAFGWKTITTSLKEDEDGPNLPDPNAWRLRSSTHDLTNRSSRADFEAIPFAGALPGQSIARTVSALNPDICEIHLFPSSLPNRSEGWIDAFILRSVTIWEKSCFRKTDRRCPIPQILTTLGHASIEPVISRFSRDSTHISFPELLRYLAWFGFSTTVFPFVQQTLSNEFSHLKSLIWPNSAKVIKDMADISEIEWALGLGEKPGEFVLFGTEEIVVKFDAITDRFSVGVRQFGSWDEILHAYGVVVDGPAAPAEIGVRWTGLGDWSVRLPGLD
jgi:hypothetical protein